MRPRASWLAGPATTVVAAFGVFGAAPAAAHPSPPNCRSNSMDLTLNKSRTVARNGDVIVYELFAANVAGTPCDFTGVTHTLQLPAADGTPTGEIITFESNADYVAGTTVRTVGQVAYTVNVNPGVDDIVAEARSTGVLHDAPVDHRESIAKTVGTTVTQPHATLTETVTPTSGTAPLQVTFTYTLTNDSLTPSPIANPVVTDDKCQPVVPTGGDANGNGLLDVGEAWTYSCTTTLLTPGPVTSTATATGTDAGDGRPVPITPASATVIVAAPPPTGADAEEDSPDGDGQGGGGGGGGDDEPTATEVLGKSLASPNSRQARRDAPCIAVPTALRVRARERTMVRVRVAERGRRAETALVRIVGPGISRRKVTNARGIATFRVRARRAGTLVIQSDRCIGADRVSVLRARQVTNDQVPRGTG